MDSKQDILNDLLEEGRNFTFENFCYPNETDEGQFCGADLPEWLAWKTRTGNVVRKLASPESSALVLAETALGINTRGSFLDEL